MRDNRETNESNRVETHEPEEKGRVEEEKGLEAMSLEELTERVQVLQEDLEAARDLHMRCQADMENMKKRHQKDKEDWRRFALEKLIKELLPALDNLEKAIDHAREGDSLEALQEGVELTLKGLKEAMARVGLEEVKAEGEPFDPCFHEAISVLEDPTQEAGKILQSCQKGYLLNERLIRPSLVIVNQGAGGESPADNVCEPEE